MTVRWVAPRRTKGESYWPMRIIGGFRRNRRSYALGFGERQRLRPAPPSGQSAPVIDVTAADNRAGELPRRLACRGFARRAMQSGVRAPTPERGAGNGGD